MARKRKLTPETVVAKLKAIGLLLEERYGDDPVGFFKDCIDFSGLKLDFLTEQQIQICKNLLEFKKLAVSSGTGIGKTAIAALLSIWGLLCHYESKIILTGPVGDQVEDGLWSEVSKWIERCKYGWMLNAKTRKIHIKGLKHWQLTVRTPSKESLKDKKNNISGKMAGMHADWMLIVVDEASDVSDNILLSFDATLTDENNHILLISNPGSTSGFFYDIVTSQDHKGYCFLQFSNINSPLVREGFAEEIARTYGENSNEYRVKVLGEPIVSNDSRIVTPDEYDRIVMHQRDFHSGRIVVGIDVGGVGEDIGVLCHRQGYSITRWDSFERTDPIKLAQKTMEICDMLYPDKQVYIVVDAIGEGSGTFSYLKQYYKRAVIIGHKGSEKAFERDKFKLRREEVLYKLKEEFNKLHFPVKPPKELKKEIVNVYFKEDPKGFISVVTKDELKKLVGHSTNYLDALSLTCALDSVTVYEKVYVPQNFIKPLELISGWNDSEGFGEFGKFLM